MVLLAPPQTGSTPTRSLLDSFTFPLPLTRFAETYLLPLIGTLREPKRSTNAWPLAEMTPPPGLNAMDGGGAGLFGAAGLRRRLVAAGGGGETAPAERRAAVAATARLATDAPATPTPVTGEPPAASSVVSQWVDELTARGTAPRAPTEDEVRV